MAFQEQIFPALDSIAHPFKGILLDAYGVFWSGNSTGLFPGAKEAMEKLVSHGKFVGILSNSTQLAAKEIDKLEKHGLIQGRHFHFLLTSGEITKQLFHQEQLPFATPQKKYWVFSDNHPKFSSAEAIFKDTSYSKTPNLHEADFIYLSIPHLQGEDQTDPELFREEVRHLTSSGLPMVCANPDRFAHEGNPPRAVVRQGSLAAMYHEMGGSVWYFGKPSGVVYSAAMERFKHQNIHDPSAILMVGDTPETDILGARNFGMQSALITQTGIFADRISYKGLDRAIKNLSSLETPQFFIEKLA